MTPPPAVILCGGMGLRLREETERRPKPLVEIGGKPILWHLMKIYNHYGVRDFVLCLGYLGEMIKRYFLHYNIMNSDCRIHPQSGAPPLIEVLSPGLEDWTVTLADTGLEAQTGARIKRIERYITTDMFMLTYGDGLADINIAKLLEFHRRHGKIATVTGVHPSSRFGELMSEGGRVVEFSEKPQARAGLINGGFFVFNRKVFSYLSDSPNCVLEGEPLERLARDRELMVYAHEGFWQCMDTYRDFHLLNSLWTSGKASWKIW